jgi:hypothetical protein
VNYAVTLTHHLQRMLHRDFEIPMEGLQLDDDEDLCFVVEGWTCWASLLIEEGGATWARLWTVAARDLKRSARLLREVNEINTALRGCRVLLTDSGRLIVAAEVLAESIEPGELALVVGGITSCASSVGELVQLFHGTPASVQSSEVDQ